MSSFDQLSSVPASTKRSGGIVNGLETGYVENIASLRCLPLDPVEPEIAQSVEGAWHEVLQTTCEGSLDILRGDILVVGSNEYEIRAISDWTWPPTGLVYQTLLLTERV